MCTIKMQLQERLDNNKCSVITQQLHIGNVCSVRTKKPTHVFIWQEQIHTFFCTQNKEIAIEM